MSKQRSQHKNKETCFKMLKARLYENEMQKKEEENQKELTIRLILDGVIKLDLMFYNLIN